MPDDSTMAPGVRISTASSETGPSEPCALQHRLLHFTHEDSDAQAGRATLVFDNRDLSLFDQPALMCGALLDVSWGYPNHMTRPHRVEIKRISGFEELTVEAFALSVQLAKEAQTRHWNHMTASQIVRTMAANYAMPLAIENTTHVFDVMNEAGESDAQFLQRLAETQGMVFYVDQTGFHWHRRRVDGVAQHVLHWRGNRSSHDLMSVHLDCDITRRVSRLERRGRNPLTKETVAAMGTTQGPGAKLRESVYVPDLDGTTNTFVRRNAATTVAPTAATTQQSVVAETNNHLGQNELNTLRMTVTLLGRPTLAAKTVVEMRGMSSFLSGRYYVQSVKHDISASGYVSTLSLRRDGPGVSAHLPPQPNAMAPTSQENTRPGELKPRAVFDWETDTMQLQYDLQGVSLGAQDAEAL